MLESQQIFNGLVGLASFLVTWMFKMIWGELNALKRQERYCNEERAKFALYAANEFARKDDVDVSLNKMSDKVVRLENLEVILASQYVTKADFTRICDKMLYKLDKIDEKLDDKADKSA